VTQPRKSRVFVGVLTFNAVSTLRMGLVEETAASAVTAFGAESVVVFDNSSTDGSEKVWEGESRFSTCCHRAQDGNTSPGRGRNAIMRLFRRELWPRDIVVLSDDDVRWDAAAGMLLKDFWRHAPDDLVLVSGLLEPDWPWNKPRELVDHGGVKALVRDSAPAAAWSFRARDWNKIGLLREIVDDTGEDFEACERLRALGYRVAQIPLATHIGEGYSQLGNDEARKLAGRPLDRAHWGI